MTGDHVNKYLFNGTLPFLYEAGRLAMPLFVFVLAYNLARPGGAEQGAYRRTMIRLALFGVLATPAFIALGSLMAGWFPLNILFTLLVIAAVIALTDRARAGDNAAAMVAVLVFLVGGGLVEFWWPSVAFGVASWWVLQKPELDGPSGRRGGLFLALLDQRQSLGACGPAARCGGFPARPVPAATALGVLRLLPAAPVALLLIRIPMGAAGYLFL